MKTKKNKSTKLLKIGILFFGISLLLWNCEKDENSHDHQEHQIAKIDYLNIEELPEVASAISGLNNLGSKNNNTASRSMSTDFGSLNLTSILEYANNDGKLTYSFLIDKENSSNTPYSFENLHLVKVENGFFGYILKWEPNEQWIEANDFNFSIQNFTGTQTHYDLDYNVIQIAEFNNGQIVNNLVGKTISNRSNQNRRYMEYICTSIFGDLCTDTGASYCGGSICGFGVKTSCSWQEAGGGSATGGSDNDSGNGTNGESESGGGGTRIPRNNDSSDVDVANGDAIVVPIPPSYEDYFDKHIFIDQDFKDKPCLKAVYNAMGKATKFKEYLQNFENDMSVADLRFTTDDNFSGNEDADYHNAMAITKPPLTSNEIKIKFNTDPNTTGNILNKPDVFKAVSMIHEIIHAEMYRKMLDAMIVAQGAGTTLDWTNLTYDEFRQYIDVTLQNKYFGIWDYYVRYDDNDDTPDNGQHQQMAQHYRDIVKQALTDYDPTLTEEQKEALSWIGLNEANIVAWQNLDENPNLNTQQEQAAINSTITQIKNTFPNECN
jgi:hypothetical protein